VPTAAFPAYCGLLASLCLDTASGRSGPASTLRYSGLLRRFGPTLTAVAAGGLFPLGFAPFEYALVAPLSLAVLFLLWLTAGPLPAALLGFWFGIGAFGVGVSWVYVSLHDFGQMPAPLAILAVVIFVLMMSGYIAATGWLQSCCRQHGSAVRLLLVMPACWILGEWLRGWLFSGFPWLYLGYGLIDTPLAALAPAGGVLAVGAAGAVCGAAIMMLVTGPLRDRVLAVCTLVIVGAGVLVLDRIEFVQSTGKPLRIAIIQQNVSLERKWSADNLEAIAQDYLSVSRQVEQADLIVWPEAALPLYYDQIPPAYLTQLRALPADILLGVLERSRNNERTEFFNSALGLGVVDSMYRKQRLVPFGEFLPFRPLFSWVLNYLNIPMSDFAAWPTAQLPMRLAGQPVGVSICYENEFGHLIRKSLPASAVLINLSEEGWFGNSLAPHQRLQMARMRAMESGRALIRASNNGLSALISAKGNLLTVAPQFQPDTVRGSVVPMSGVTPFVRLGNLPILLLSVLVIAGSFLKRFRYRTV